MIYEHFLRLGLRKADIDEMPLYLALLAMGGVSVDKQELQLSSHDTDALRQSIERGRPAAAAAAELRKQRVRDLLSRAKRQSHGG